MARFICSSIAVLGLLAGMPLAASADGGRRTHHVTKREVNPHHATKREVNKWRKWKQDRHNTQQRKVAVSTTGVPELDPGAAGAALSLLAGGALVLSERRRRASV